MCKGVWGSVREGGKKDPRATARARGGGHRDVGRERLSTYVEREEGVRVKGEEEERDGVGVRSRGVERASMHRAASPEKHPRTHDGAGLGAKFHLSNV
jgi:hypothetical protein